MDITVIQLAYNGTFDVDLARAVCCCWRLIMKTEHYKGTLITFTFSTSTGVIAVLKKEN